MFPEPFCRLIEISDCEAGVRAWRRILGKTWPVECFAAIPSLTHAFLYSCKVSPPGLPIAGMREVSWKKASVLRFPNPPLPPHQSYYSFLGLFLSPASPLSSSLPTHSSFISPSLKNHEPIPLFPRSHYTHSSDAAYSKHSVGSCLSSKMLSSGRMKATQHWLENQGLSVIWLADMKSCLWILVTGESREIMAPCQQLLELQGTEEERKRWPVM